MMLAEFFAHQVQVGQVIYFCLSISFYENNISITVVIRRAILLQAGYTSKFHCADDVLCFMKCHD